MAVDIKILDGEKITYKHLFDLGELYGHANSWLKHNGYTVEEKAYKEKVGAGGKDIDIEWEATKDLDEYSKFKLAIEWSISGLTDVEVQKEGGNVKMNKGEVSIEVSMALVLDYKDKWEESPWLKFNQFSYCQKGHTEIQEEQLKS